MTDPVSTTPAWATTVNASGGAYTAGLGALAQLVGQLKAASDARAISHFNADVAQANAQAQAQANEIEAQQYLRQAELAQQDQLAAQDAGRYREDRQREQQARMLSQTRAIIASSGLMLSGSPLAVVEEQARQSEMDILAGRYQTALQVRAAGEDVTQRTYAAEVARYGAGERLRVGRMQSQMIQAEGDTAFAGGLLAATGAAVRGLSSASELYQRASLRKGG